MSSEESLVRMLICTDTSELSVLDNGINTKICAGLREKSTVSKTCVKRPLLKRQKMVFKINYRLINAGQTYCRMLQVDHSAILSTFIKLPINSVTLGA